MVTVASAAAAGANQGTPPVKPKRKKPGTAIKRKVQPITVDAKGNKANESRLRVLPAVLSSHCLATACLKTVGWPLTCTLF